jgi:hypothetical protein
MMGTFLLYRSGNSTVVGMPSWGDAYVCHKQTSLS